MSSYLGSLAGQAKGSAPTMRPPRKPRAYDPAPTVDRDEGPIDETPSRPRRFGTPFADTGSRHRESRSTVRVELNPPATARRAADEAAEGEARIDAAAAEPRSEIVTETLHEIVDRIVNRAGPNFPVEMPALLAGQALDDADPPTAPMPQRGAAIEQSPETLPNDGGLVTNIHIGRIELTALAPQPARRAAASADKRPMSLDEYLRRRDGRSR